MLQLSRFTRSRTTLLLTFGGVALVVLTGTSGFLLWKYMSVKDDAKTGNAAAQQETATRIIDQVNKLYKLPTGEEPTVAAVDDKTQLAGQVFFKDAQNGDYLLIYKQSKLALLYREGESRLINVGPISLNEEQAGQTAGASTKETKQ